MKLSRIPLCTAAALATVGVPLCEALRTSQGSQLELHSGGGALEHLFKGAAKSPEVATFIQETVEAEMTEQLHSKLMDQLRATVKDLEPASSGSPILKKIMEALKPALKSIFASTTKALKPVVAAECKRVISEVQSLSAGEDHGTESDEGAGEGEESNEEASFIATLQADQGFWDSVKDTVKKGFSSIAGPALEALTEKLAPTFQKLGEKAVPLFKDQVTKLIQNACEEAEHDAGLVE